ncbi:MAG: hypothetical protein IMZ69_00635 [Spirochaetes bacterium]|nr:hypothetical protein [Spirochaetota bacterium]
MTRIVFLTAHEGHLLPRQLPGQHVALAVAEVPVFYSDLEVFTIARAVADARAMPLDAQLTWSELLGTGLSAGVLAFESRSLSPRLSYGGGRVAGGARENGHGAARNPRLDTGAPGRAARSRGLPCHFTSAAEIVRCRPATRDLGSV